MFFMIADPHFGDENIRKYENRPFSDVKEMNKVLIENWNNVVKEEDRVFVLGDFSVSGYEREVLEQLNGNIFLIKGNHDGKTNQEYRDMGFAEVYDYPIILDGFWILSHEPLYVNENMPYANIFGHVHGSPLYRDYSSQHYCVSLERTNYTPLSFDEIKKTVAAAASHKKDT